MRTRDLDGLHARLAMISTTMIGLSPCSDVVSRALHDAGEVPGQRFGLPSPLVAALDLMFTGLPWDEARATALALPAAIGWEGRALRGVAWRLLAAEAESLWPVVEGAPGDQHIRHLLTRLGSGLAFAAEAQPWMDGIDFLDDLPHPPPPAGSTGDARLRTLAYHAVSAIRAAAKAVLFADTAIASVWRRKRVAAGSRGWVDNVRRAAERQVSQDVTVALSEAVRTAATAAPEAADDLARKHGAEVAALVAYRRQAAVLLNLIRNA